MRISPLNNALIYLVLGCLFTYGAYQTIEDTTFKPLTIILVIFATLDFGAAIRFVQIHLRLKEKRK